MEHDIVINSPNRTYKELFFLFCGKSQCFPKHHFGPSVRPNYIIHIITSGQGKFVVKNKTYHLKKGDCFIIEPNVLTYYEADLDNPWKYFWVGFSGEKATEHINLVGIDLKTPVFLLNDTLKITTIIDNMLSKYKNTISNQYYLQGLLFQFFGEIKDSIYENVRSQYLENDYVTAVSSFIETHYNLPIQVNDIADYVNLDRSYISNLFKSSTGKTIKQYLTEFRISRSKELLTLTDLTVSQIAESCGYSTPLVFSKNFQKINGCNPADFRKKSHYSKNFDY